MNLEELKAKASLQELLLIEAVEKAILEDRSLDAKEQELNKVREHLDHDEKRLERKAGKVLEVIQDFCRKEAVDSIYWKIQIENALKTQ
jgi:hypothetical protein